MQSDALAWAREEFGALEAGDRRRTWRLANMAARAWERPAGKVSEVFQSEKERQGAYDLLEGGHVSAESLVSAMGYAAAQRASAESFAYVAIDGASLSLTDTAKGKDFGRIGAQDEIRGLKVINALGLTPQGTPLGIFAQVWWARPPTPARSGSKRERRAKKDKSKKQRGPGEKETRYWLQAIEDATARAQEAGARLWFVLDREADCHAILTKLTDSNHQFTVRGSWDRVIEGADDESARLFERLQQKSSQGTHDVDVAPGPKRTARLARCEVRWQRVILRMRAPQLPEQLLELTAVWALERGTCPPGEAPLNWLLLTSADVRSLTDARQVIFGYALRWRIECFHKTWKTGACDVEKTQLHRLRAVTLWATLLAAVAARIERLKYLSRSDPDQPATVELDSYEIRALILLKRERKKKTEVVSDEVPTIAQATRWIADLGGYTGKSSGGPPGSITIRRGLDFLRPAAEVLRRLHAEK